MTDKATLVAILGELRAFDVKLAIGGLAADDKAQFSKTVAEFGALLAPDVDAAHLEIPRHVKKPGESKVVHTREDLDAALAEGWVLKLEDYIDPNPAPRLWKSDPVAPADPVAEPDVPTDPDGAPPADPDEPAPDPDLASALTADLDAQDADAPKKKSTTHAHGGAKKK